MKFDILFVIATGKARIAWSRESAHWGVRENGTDVVSASLETMKEFVMSLLDCGWDVTIKVL